MTKLTDFARACKAAARAVTLYPSSHPAIRASMSRLVDTAGRMTANGPVILGVLPDNLLLGGSGAQKPDQAVRETGALLHDHMIGMLTMHASPNPESWLPFLQLLATPIDEVRAGGGVSRLWAATGQRHLDIQEIDYADILRDRGAGEQSQWDDIIRACMNLDSPLDDEALRNLVEMCGDPERFGEFIIALESADGGTGSKAAALIRMLRGVVDMVAKTDPSRLEPMLRNMAQGFGKLSPELLMELLSSEAGRADAAADLVLRVAARMTDATLGGFVARGVMAEGGATTRLAQAFQTLVPDKERRPGLLELAKAEVEQSPLGATEDFLNLWKNAADMLTSYSDEQFVSEAYARELSGARTQALEVERVSDDPPERIGAWITSVGPSELRTLDLQLLLDLLAIESDPDRWRKVTLPAIGHIEDLLLVGDFDGGDAAGHRVCRRSEKRNAQKGRGRRRAQPAGGRRHDVARHLASAHGRRPRGGADQNALLHGGAVGDQAAGGGAGHRKADVHAAAADAAADRVRRRRPAVRRAAQGLGESGRPPHGDLPAARIRRIGSAAGSHRAAGRCGAAHSEGGGARHPGHRHRRGVRRSCRRRSPPARTRRASRSWAR